MTFAEVVVGFFSCFELVSSFRRKILRRGQRVIKLFVFIQYLIVNELINITCWIEIYSV